MSDPERDAPPSVLEALYAAERDRPPLASQRIDAIREAVDSKVVPPDGGGPDGDGGAPSGGGSKGPSASLTSSGGGVTSPLGVSHAVALVSGLVAGVALGVLGHAAHVGAPPFASQAGEQQSTAPTRQELASGGTRPGEVLPAGAGPSASSLELPARTDPPADPPLAPVLVASARESSTRADEPTTTLAAERRLVDAARAALSAGRTEPALSALATHRHRFARGALAEERDALEVEALASAGRTAEAAVAAAAFERVYPGSLHRARVRAAAETEPRRAPQ